MASNKQHYVRPLPPSNEDITTDNLFIRVMFKTAQNNTEQILVYTAFPLTIIHPIPKKHQCTLGYK